MDQNQQRRSAPAGRRPAPKSRSTTPQTRSAAPQTRSTRSTAPTAKAAPAKLKSAAAVKKQSAKKQPAKKKRQKVRFRNKNLKYQLLTVIAVVLALLVCLIVFFRVKTVNVFNQGTDPLSAQSEDETAEHRAYYTAEEIEKASGIEHGDNLLTMSKEAVAARIMAELPYVSEVHIQRVLPGTVNISISEFDVAYAIRDTSDGWWLINRDGKVMDSTTEAEANSYTVINGLRITDPKPAAKITPEEAEDMAEQSAKCTSLISILQELETYGYCKQIVSIDLTASYDIELWHGTQYQIRIGNTQDLSYKLSYLDGVLKELKSYQTGIIDLTFAEDNAARFQPFT